MEGEQWRLERFAEAFSSARGLDAQIEVLRHAIGSYGYDTYVFGLVPNSRQNHLRDLILVTNYDDAWMREYADNEFRAHDNLITHCLVSDEPVLWSRYHTADERAVMTPEEAFVIERSTAWGYHVGVTIPLWVPHSMVRYGMSFSTLGLMDFDAHDENFRRNQHTLVAIAKLFFLGANFSEKIYAHFDLSELDQKIIALLVNGWKLKEIVPVINRERARSQPSAHPMGETALHQRIVKIWKKVGVRNTAHLAATLSLLGVQPEFEDV